MNMKFIKNPTIIAMIALVVVTGGVAGTAAYILNSRNDQSSNKTTINTPSGSASADSTGQKTSESQTPQPPAPKASSTPGSPSPQSGATVAPPAGSSSNTTNIIISGSAFSPATITVKKGTSVTWVNKDTGDHGIMESDDLSGPHSPLLKPNNSYIYTFNTVGTYHYSDAITPALTGTVTVTN